MHKKLPDQVICKPHEQGRLNHVEPSCLLVDEVPQRHLESHSNSLHSSDNGRSLVPFKSGGASCSSEVSEFLSEVGEFLKADARDPFPPLPPVDLRLHQQCNIPQHSGAQHFGAFQGHRQGQHCGASSCRSGGAHMSDCVSQTPHSASRHFAFLEVFSGEEVLTTAVQAQGLACDTAWDVQKSKDFDVLVYGNRLVAKVKEGCVQAVHFGTPCQSFSAARDPPLRGHHAPLGLPGLPSSAMELVRIGNEFAEFTAQAALVALAEGAYFSIENPRSSWLWTHPAIRELAARPGVGFTIIEYTWFGAAWKKPTAFLHNLPTLYKLKEYEAGAREATVRLRGTCWWDGREQFRTALASAYPPLLGVAYAEALAEALTLKAEATARGEPIPMMDLAHDAGCPLQTVTRYGNVTLVARCATPVHALERGLEGGPDRASVRPLPNHNPFVPDGDGQPKGLAVMEQVEWMKAASHPLDFKQLEFDPDLAKAIAFELATESAAIDAYRLGVIEHWKRRAAALEPARQRWLRKVDPAQMKLVSRIHGPLAYDIMDSIDYEDRGLVEAWRSGFPYVGKLPSAGVAVRSGTPVPLGLLSARDLRARRSELNPLVVRKLKATEWDGDVLRSTHEDVDFGAMAGPWPLSDVDTSCITLSRRLPVREEREAGWRTRIVDHKTESEVNCATQPSDKLAHDTIDVLVSMLRMFLVAGLMPVLWKRDIGMAFRRLAIATQHLDLSWVVFMAEGVAMVAQHLAMPFGTTSAVHAWHRTGAFLLAAVRRLCLAPAARYVDDYFGVSRDDVFWTGGKCLDILAELLGFPCKAEKSVEEIGRLVVLGARVAVNLAAKTISVQIDEKKSTKWTNALLDLLKAGKCEQSTASRMAGRLTFAVTVSLGKVGRAYIRPFFAQANSPTPRLALSQAMRHACSWWVEWLTMRFDQSIDADSSARKRIEAWTDASGASRCLSAVVHASGQWYYTHMTVPDQIWDLFLPRSDDQIGMQEFLAVPLLFATFEPLIQGSLLLLAVDNQGVLHALIKGRSSADDLNLGVGRHWLDVSRLRVAQHVVRVESASNIADGPSREDYSLLEAMGATYVPPKLPQWCFDLWGSTLPSEVLVTLDGL